MNKNILRAKKVKKVQSVSCFYWQVQGLGQGGGVHGESQGRNESRCHSMKDWGKLSAKGAVLHALLNGSRTTM